MIKIYPPDANIITVPTNANEYIKTAKTVNPIKR